MKTSSSTENTAGSVDVHKAAQKGNITNLRRFITAGGNVNLLKGGSAALHRAAHYDQVKAAELLLSEGKANALIPQKKSRATPAHLAALSGSLGVLKVLSKHLNAKELQTADHKGETPLHWAARSGHFEGALHLLQKGGDRRARSSAGETPFDLALKHGHDDLCYLLAAPLTTPGSQLIFSSSSDKTSSTSSNKAACAEQIVACRQKAVEPSKKSASEKEGFFYRSMEESYEKKRVFEQVYWLDRLGECCRKRSDFVRAAHLWNGALSLADREWGAEEYRSYFVSKLEGLEATLVAQLTGQKGSKKGGSIVKRQAALKQSRSRLREEFQSKKRPINHLVSWYTGEMKRMLTSLIVECKAELGIGSNVSFAAVGLGSMARDEMAPFSDIEFLFLVPNHNHLKTLRKLDKLLTLKVINCGETKFDAIQLKRANSQVRPAHSFTKGGFSMDIGGLSPAGKEGVYELIGTPKELSYYLTKEWLQGNPSEVILVNAIATPCYVMGEHSLYKEYIKCITKRLNQKEGGFLSKHPPLQRERAVALLKGFLEDFNTRLDHNKIVLRATDVKRELYRPIQTVVRALALFHGVAAPSTLARIEALKKKKALSVKGADHLAAQLLQILNFRVQTHLFYNQEKEILYLPKGGDDQDAQGLLSIDNAVWAQVKKLFRSTIPLLAAAKEFIEGDADAFARSSFLDTSIGTYNAVDAIHLEIAEEFDTTLRVTAEIAALNPNDPTYRVQFGVAQRDVGETKKALQNHKEALKALVTGSGDNEVDRADALSEVGVDLFTLGRFEEALIYHQNALALREKNRKKDIRGSYAVSLMNVGIAHASLGRHAKAIELYRKALVDLDPKSLDASEVHNSLGISLSELGQYTDAIKHYQTSIELYNTKGTRARSLLNMGNTYSKMGKKEKALSVLEESLSLYKDLHPKAAHLDLLIARGFLIDLLFSTHSFDKGQPYCQEQLKDATALYMKDSSALGASQFSPSLAAAHMRVAKAHIGLSDPTKAMAACKKAIYYYSECQKGRAVESSQIKSSSSSHSQKSKKEQGVCYLYEIANAYLLLADISYTLGKKVERLEALNKANKICEEYRKKEGGLKVTSLFTRLAMAYSEREFDLKRACDFASKAVQVARSLEQQEKALFLPHCLEIKAILLARLGKKERSIQISSAALACYEERYGNKASAPFAFFLNEIGVTYKLKGRFQEALKLYHRSVQMYETLCSLGESGDSRTTPTLVWRNIANVYLAMEDKRRALDSLKKSVEWEQKMNPSNFSEGAFVALRNLHLIAEQLKELETALHYRELECSLRASSVQRARSLDLLGQLYFRMGKRTKAIESLQESIEEYKKVDLSSAEKREFIASLQLFARFSQEDQNLRKAVDALKEIDQLVDQESLEEEATRAHSIGEHYFLLKRPADALPYFRRTLSIRQRQGEQHAEECSRLHCNISNLLSTLAKPDEAIVELRLALQQVKKSQKLLSHRIHRIYCCAGNVYIQMQAIPEAVWAFERALEWEKRVNQTPSQERQNYLQQLAMFCEFYGDTVRLQTYQKQMFETQSTLTITSSSRLSSASSNQSQQPLDEPPLLPRWSLQQWDFLRASQTNMAKVGRSRMVAVARKERRPLGWSDKELGAEYLFLSSFTAMGEGEESLSDAIEFAKEARKLWKRSRAMNDEQLCSQWIVQLQAWRIGSGKNTFFSLDPNGSSSSDEGESMPLLFAKHQNAINSNETLTRSDIEKMKKEATEFMVESGLLQGEELKRVRILLEEDKSACPSCCSCCVQ